MLNKGKILLILMITIVLAGCAAGTSSQGNQAAGSVNQNSSLESRLALGTLELEGTNQAVSAEQAKQLLPLWQKIKTLAATPSSTQAADLQAVYTQIEAAMTPAQIKTIESLRLNQNDIQALMKSLGIQITPGPNPNGGNFPTQSPSDRATRTARRTQMPGSNDGGFGGGNGNGGTGSGNSGGNSSGGGFGGGNSGRTGGSGAPGNGNRGFGGYGQMFLDPLIQILQKRAGA
jgi:hypothetical protein